MVEYKYFYFSTGVMLMFDNFKKVDSKITSAVVNLIMAVIGGLAGSIITIYLDKSIDWELNSGKYFETAYYQAILAKEVFEKTTPSNSQLPMNKLLYDNPDWNDIFFEAHDDKFSKIYYKISYLDDLRDKIFQESDSKDKELLCLEYWRVFDEIKKNDDIGYFTDKLNFYRYATKEARRKEEAKRQQEELIKKQQEREKNKSK